MATTELTLDHVLALARRLPLLDQARLISHLAPILEQALSQSHPQLEFSRPPLRGLLADLSPIPSDSDIRAIREEMWKSFPSDIV